MRDFLTRLALNAVCQLHAQEIGGLFACWLDRPVQLLVANHQPVHGVERAQNVFARAQAQRAEENRSQKLALTIDAHVEHVLLIVFKFHPGSAVRNDLAEEIGAVVCRLKEHARRAVQLADDHTLGAIDNKCAVGGHQWHVTEKDLLLLNVADGAVASLRIFFIDRQAHGHLERRRIGHAALFALADVILQLQADGVTALVAEVRSVGIVCAALAAEHITRVKWIGDDSRSAIAAGRTQVVQTFQVAALALPVADCVVHELQLRDIAEISNREHGLKDRLEPGIVALTRQPIHLQEAIIGALLNLDQVWNLDGGRNF